MDFKWPPLDKQLPPDSSRLQITSPGHQCILSFIKRKFWNFTCTLLTRQCDGKKNQALLSKTHQCVSADSTL